MEFSCFFFSAALTSSKVCSGVVYGLNTKQVPSLYYPLTYKCRNLAWFSTRDCSLIQYTGLTAHFFSFSGVFYSNTKSKSSCCKSFCQQQKRFSSHEEIHTSILYLKMSFWIFDFIQNSKKTLRGCRALSEEVIVFL